MAFYPAIPASDGTSMTPPENAEFQVYELSDTTFASPLPLQSTAGLNAAPLVTTGQGVVPPVNVVSPNFSHIFKSGEWEWRRDSFDAAEAATRQSAADAQDARLAAEEAARNTSAPTQEAIATALTSDGPARDALGAEVRTATSGLAEKPDNGAKAVGKGELVVNVRDFGAVGDGVTDDAEALQRFFNHLATNGGRGYAAGQFLHRKIITLTNPTRGFTLETAGRTGTEFIFRSGQGGSGFSFVGLHDVTWGASTIDGGYAETGSTGHGIAIRNPDNVTLIGIHVRNYSGAGILMFANDADAGQWGRSTTIDCSYDGNGVASNGFLFAALRDSKMVRPAGRGLGRTSAQSPSYGVQLKNACYNCHIIDAAVDGAKGGLVMASDQPDGGPEHCSITGQTMNCTEHIVMGKSKSSTIRGSADMRGDVLTSRAVAIGANSDGNFIQVALVGSGVAGSAAPIFVNYSNNTVEVEYAADYGTKLVELGTGVRNNRLIVKALSGAVVNPSGLVQDGSGNATNQLAYTPALAGMTSLNDTDPAFLRFMSPSNSTTWLSFNHSLGQFGMRSQGVDVFAVNRASIQPGADVTQTLGTSGRRWTTIYAQTATINTSDARTKQDWEANLSPELRAWSKVEFGKYRLRDSVQEKGDGARWHFGVIAQQVKEAFESEGLDPFIYGILCYDKWDATAEEVNGAGEVTQRAIPAGDRYGIRYEEALVLEAAYMRATLEGLSR